MREVRVFQGSGPWGHVGLCPTWPLGDSAEPVWGPAWPSLGRASVCCPCPHVPLPTSPTAFTWKAGAG